MTYIQNQSEVCNPSVYRCSDKGLLLPFVNESQWSEGVRAFAYLLGLLWCFLGVSIIADVFMQSIEMITSRTARIQVPDPDNENEYMHVDIRLWNGTVANLTLMALGASAPETLLSVIEMIGGGFTSGELGPFVVFGAAAFNTLFIMGVCICAIPGGEVRKVRKVGVFVLTSLFSVLAYVWVLLVTVVITPGHVDVWEAVVTVFLFPALVINAYLVDKDYCRGAPPHDDQERQVLG